MIIACFLLRLLFFIGLSEILQEGYEAISSLRECCAYLSEVQLVTTHTSLYHRYHLLGGRDYDTWSPTSDVYM